MRESNGTEFVLTDDGQFMCVVLGHNWCSEHEWGIDSLRRSLGVMDDKDADRKGVFSMDRIKVTAADPIQGLIYQEGGNGVEGDDTILGFHRHFNANANFYNNYETPMQVAALYKISITPLIKRDKAGRKRKLNWTPSQTLSAWDAASFCITTRDEANRGHLRELEAAFKAGDIVLHVGGSPNPFKPVTGLVLGIRSRIPSEVQKTFEDAHRDRWERTQAALATGIAKRLENAGCGYYALDPAWTEGGVKTTTDGRTIQTKHPVIFFLNPKDQKNCNYGWFTVEDLEAWTRGEGPIPMKKV
jgi:hypothetical protein